MAAYKLTYFSMRGRGEIPRLILIKNGIKFEDVTIDFYEEWPTVKDTLKNLPNGQLPILEVEGKVLYQSTCICRFLGKRFGMYGSNEWEESKIGAIHLTMEDICRMPFDAAFDVENEEEKEKIRKEFRKKLPVFLKSLEALVESEGCFVGNTMTVADLAFFVYHDFFHLVDNIVINWSDYPKLRSVIDKVKSDPKIAEWVRTRPVTIV